MRKGKAAVGVGITIALFVLGIITLAALAISSYSNTCCVDGGVKTITLVSAFLFTGNPTNSTHRGTSSLAISFDNPGSTTSITSISITGADLPSNTVFQCSSSTSCKPLSSASLPGSTTTHFDTNATAFYFSTNFTSGQVYNYVINFADGQSVSGSLIAQDPQTLPAVSPNYSVVQSSSSSACTFTPYYITETSIGGNDSETMIETTLVSC